MQDTFQEQVEIQQNILSHRHNENEGSEGSDGNKGPFVQCTPKFNETSDSKQSTQQQDKQKNAANREELDNRADKSAGITQY